MQGGLGFFSSCLLTAVPILIFVGGFYFSVRLRFVFFLHPIRCIRTAVRGSRGDGTGRSPLRAVTMALAGTLGVGNIAGVGLALLVGGAGSVLWMWVSALFAMALKYAEVLLSRLYRPKDEGGCRGGAMLYMAYGIGKKRGKALAGVFAFLCLMAALTLGGGVQASAIGEAMTDGLSFSPPLVGAVLCVAAAVPIFCGRRLVEGVIGKLLPAASVFYIILTVTVIACHLGNLPTVLWSIFSAAFSFRSAGGGLLGFLTSRALRVGATRGLLSNEAGCGTSPMAHAESKATPAAEGLYGVFEVFVDTVVICTLTALAILSVFPSSLPDVSGGVSLAILAFTDVFPKTGAAALAVSIAVFAYATILCWAYYSENCILWFTKSRIALTLFRIAFALSLPAGVLLSSGLTFYLTDLVLAGLTLLNCLTVLYLSKEVIGQTREEGLLPSRRPAKKPRLRMPSPKGGKEGRK